MNKIATKSKAGAVKWHLFNGFQIDPGHAAELIIAIGEPSRPLPCEKG
jgi:hypothetical protein